MLQSFWETAPYWVAILLLVVGYPAEGVLVPLITKKSREEIVTFL